MKTKNRIEEITSLLQEGVSMVYSSDAWRDLLLFQSKFHNYSFKNMMLIYFQKPNASQIGSIKFWNSLGRRVKTGEKKVKNDETGEEENKLTGWFLTPVYDVSQTQGKELPSLIQELSMDTETLRGFYQTLKVACPFSVEEIKLDNGVKGYFDYNTESIAVKKGLSALHKCKTLVHEMAHGLLHKETDKSRDVREVEAEGTAFVVLSYFGFDTSEYSFGYVAGWNGSKDATAIIDSGNTIIQERTNTFLRDAVDSIQSDLSVYTKGEHGYWVFVDTGTSDIPEELSALIELADINDCIWLVLDADGMIIEGLPTWEW